MHYRNVEKAGKKAEERAVSVQFMLLPKYENMN